MKVRFIFSNQNPSRKTIKKILYQKLETNEENLVKIFLKKKELKISTNIFSIVFLSPNLFFQQFDKLYFYIPHRCSLTQQETKPFLH